MRLGAVIALAILALGARPGTPAHADSCANDSVTVETIRGTIIDIKLAPEPFRSADIYVSGPAPCTALWMQVLKPDAEKCRIGGIIEVRGVVTSDPESDGWQIGPLQNEYMLLGDDYSCS